jgi:dihydropteroate synthase
MPLLPLHFALPNGRPAVMGIVNVTPDSFSDGGHYLACDAAVAHALQLVEEGCDILDIGGESTRPGATPASLAEEMDRVLPVIEALRREQPSVPLSIDTQKPAVMAAAIAAGAAMVNDIRALSVEGAIETCAASDVAVCLMHMQGEPRTMQVSPAYENVVADVLQYLIARAQACEMAGIVRQRIVIDPGIGFGKTLEHNLALLKAIPELAASGYPVLIGVSRKSMFKALFGRDVQERIVPSVVAAVRAATLGARILRVHDVRETVDALRLWTALTPES